MNYCEKLGELGYENLVNGSDVAIITGLRTIRKGQGVLKRGTALGLSAGTAGDGALVVLGTTAVTNETITANCVLAADVDTGTTADVKALVYLSGHFNTNALPVADKYTIAAADVEAFRAAGIFLDAAML